MSRHPIGERAMTEAERQARHRASRAGGVPVIRSRRPTGPRPPPGQAPRAQRWQDSVATLAALQAEYAAWLESVPANLQDTATAEALVAICDLDLSELQAIESPRGFGRD